MPCLNGPYAFGSNQRVGIIKDGKLIVDPTFQPYAPPLDFYGPDTPASQPYNPEDEK